MIKSENENSENKKLKLIANLFEFGNANHKEKVLTPTTEFVEGDEKSFDFLVKIKNSKNFEGFAIDCCKEAFSFFVVCKSEKENDEKKCIKIFSATMEQLKNFSLIEILEDNMENFKEPK